MDLVLRAVAVFVVLVQDGEIIARNARRERSTREELVAEARQQQIGRLRDVRFAMLKTNGRISSVLASDTQ